MMSSNWKKIAVPAVQVVKWGLVVWLLLPLTTSMRGQVSFARVMPGILLFIIFSGKILYDVILDKKRQRSAASDLIIMFAVVIIVVLVVAAVVVFVGLFIYYSMGTLGEQSS